MGSPADEAERDDDEGPVHKVGITKPYYIGLTEVTQGQWYAVMKTKPWEGQIFVKGGDTYPATSVNWDAAVEFCRKLGALEDRSYRLPTEAEWEYACRGGKATSYSFGSDAGELKDYAWYDKNSYDVGEKYAHIVGRKKPNSFGLYDMHGNVWEWCSDWHGEYSSLALIDPVGPSTGSIRVLRGGGWSPGATHCRAAFRGASVPTLRTSNFGFRIVLSSPSVQSPEAEPVK